VPSRVTIRQEALRLLGGWVGVANSVAAGAVTDTDLQNSRHPSETHRDAYIYRPDVAAADQVRTVSGFTNTTGALAHGGANYSDTADLDYELHYNLHPDELNRCIDRALRRIRRRLNYPLSLLADSDMEASGTTSWTAVTATLAKSTAGNTYRGAQSMTVTATSAGGYGYQTISVHEGHGYSVQGVVLASGGTSTARLRIWDATNGAEISAVDSTQRRNQFVRSDFVAPSGCVQVQVRLMAVGNGDVSLWDDVIMLEDGRTRYPLPTWISHKAQIEEVMEVTERGTSYATNREMPDAPDQDVWAWWDVSGDEAGLSLSTQLSGLFLLLDPPTRQNWRTPWVKAFRAGEALSADTSVTWADLDWVVAGTLRYALPIIANQAPPEEKAEYTRQANEWKRTWTSMCARFQPRARRRMLPGRLD